MKYLFPITVLVIACACSSKPVKREPFPFTEVTEKEWVVYEGIIVSDDGYEMDVELSLKENAVGVDSDYRLYAVSHSDSMWIGISQGRGKFSMVYGLPDNAMGVELKGSETGRPVTSTMFVPVSLAKHHNREVKHSVIVSQDFYFRTHGGDELILTDDDFDPLSKDGRYTLHKRSDLFTAEGYLTVEEDGDMEFFERNTFEKWNVARLGRSTEIDTTYKKLATIPFEGIYLKALAYSVADTSAIGEPIRKLVVKRVLEMNARH